VFGAARDEPRAPRTSSGLRVSVAVGATAVQDAQHLDDAGGVAPEAHAPLPYAQAPLVLNSSELDDVTGRRLTRETIERVNDPSVDRWVQALEVASRAAGKDPAAAGAVQANSRPMSSAEITSPRAICSRASRNPSFSSGVVGSPSIGAFPRRSPSASLPPLR
jgi:hypothetical protein